MMTFGSNTSPATELSILSQRLAAVNLSPDSTIGHRFIGRTGSNSQVTSTLAAVISALNNNGVDNNTNDDITGDQEGGETGLQSLLVGSNGDDAAYSLALLLKLRLTAEGANQQRYSESAAPYLLVLASIIFLLSLVANVLVVISVFRSRRYRATAGLLALNLTVADLLITVVLLPLWMVQQNLSASNSYLFSIIICKIHPALLTLSVGASAYTLVALSVDRMCIVRLHANRAPASGSSTFFSSHHDASSVSRRSRRSSLASWLCCCEARLAKTGTVAAPWLLSTLVAAPVLYFRTAQERPRIEDLVLVANFTSIGRIVQELYDNVSPEASCREEWPAPFQLAYDQSLLVIHFALPALVQLCLYIYLGWIVSRLTPIPPRNSQTNDSCTTMTNLQQQQTMTQQQPSGIQMPVSQQQQQQQPGIRVGPTNSPPLLVSNNPNSNNCHQNNVRPAYGSVSVVRRQRAWRTLIALSVLFPISWLPYYILYTYLVNADPAAIGPRTTSLHTLLELFAMLGFSNSAQNAIVYCATDDRLRGYVKSMLSMMPCPYRWQIRQSHLTSFNGNGHNGNGDLAYGGNNAQQVMLQMNQLTSQQQPRILTQSSKLPNHVGGLQAGHNNRHSYTRRQQPYQVNNNGGSVRSNRAIAGNNYQPSPKLLAPPAVPLTVPEEKRFNAQQQRLRSGGSAPAINNNNVNKIRQRKQATLNSNNNNDDAVMLSMNADARCPVDNTAETAILINGQRSDNDGQTNNNKL